MASSQSTLESLQQSHLDWTSKQGRILTADGRANEFYCEERGFSFDEQELPHYRLLQHDTSFDDYIPTISPISGAWSRTYFIGGWDYSCQRDETVYNVQTNSLFVDLRIPSTRHQVLPSNATSLQDYTNVELRLYARQHVFGGLSVVSMENKRPVCVRHHCLDWNFVGTPRPRPNKWWIEPMNKEVDKWKEWAYATDGYGQHYYCEQWERLEGGDSSNSVTLALRKERVDKHDDDGILVVVGNHFNYIRGKALASKKPQYEGCTSLVALVDAALEAGDRETALEWLGRIQAGHGRITDEWRIDCAIESWKEGTLLFEKGDITVEVGTLDECRVVWNGERWNVFDSNVENKVQQVQDLFRLD